MPLLQVRLHPLITASASSASPSTKASSSAIPLVWTAVFHCSRGTCPSRFRELPTKVLRKLEHCSDGLAALNELVQIGRLLSRAALFWPHHHERNASRRRRLVQDDRLFGDGTGSLPDERGEAAAQAYAATPCIASATISLYRRATLWHPWFHREERRGKVGIDDGRGVRPSSRRRRRFLLEGTIDTRRTDSDDLGNLLFVVSFSIQLPDPLMKTHSLAMTNTTFLCDFFRHRRPLSRTCFACAASGRLFEHTLLLAKELLQGFGKVLL
jgi:hypothetical protein